MTPPFASRVWQGMRIPLFLLPVSAAIAQTEPSALQWLQRIYAATEKLSYSGTFVYQQGQQEKTSRITHVVESSVDRKSTRLNSSHLVISYAVFCLKKKKKRI